MQRVVRNSRNQNRNSLNIQQPGETDSYEAFFSDPNRWKDNSTSFSLGDVLPTMGKGFAQSVRGTGEMARGLGDAMIQSPVKTGARILNEFSRMGLPGVATVQDIFAGGSRGADEVIDIAPPWRTRFAAGYLPRHCAEGNQWSETCGANGCYRETS